MIRVDGKEIESFVFSGGECQVKVFSPSVAQMGGEPHKVNVEATLDSSDEIMKLLLVNDAIKRRGGAINRLTLRYFPYARQDRVCSRGEALSVKVMADLINSIGARCVEVWDPHSDLVGALVNNVLIWEQHELITDYILNDSALVVCPDAGAEKKIQKLKRPYIMATKIRDPATGDITGTLVYADDLTGQDCVIIDDICDGGRTFIELAKVLKAKGASTVSLYVTHGIFSKGMEVFEGLIDHISWYDGSGKLTQWGTK